MNRIFALAVLMLLCIRINAQDIQLKNEGKIPSVKLTTLDDKEFNTDDIKSDGPVLFIFYANWIGSLAKIADDINLQYDKWVREANTKVYLIVLYDNEKTKEKTITKLGPKNLKYDILIDVNNLFIKGIGITEGLPYVVITDKSKTIQWKKYGYIEGDVDLYEKVIKKIAGI